MAVLFVVTSNELTVGKPSICTKTMPSKHEAGIRECYSPYPPHPLLPRSDILAVSGVYCDCCDCRGTVMREILRQSSFPPLLWRQAFLAILMSLLL